MEQAKRLSISNSDRHDDRKKQKTQTTINELDCSLKAPVSCLEDLSNELIYDIFDFLDHFHVYEGFFDLNQRFRSLLTHSTLPIVITLSSMSKSAFKRYHADIVETSLDRISIVRLSDVLMYDNVFSTMGDLSKFNRLETLILDNIPSEFLENLFNLLPTLSLLSSLVISTANNVKNKAIIYQKIFRLSSLKHCQLSLLGWLTTDSLAVNTEKYSPIEHLIITNSIYSHELDSLLSYVPQLRRLSLHLKHNTWQKRTQKCSFVFNQLTHISLCTDTMDFSILEGIISELFPLIQVLYLTLTFHSGRMFRNANEWQMLILSHIPTLRLFDMQMDVSVDSLDQISNIETMMNQLRSPFWIERQWFFSSDFYGGRYGRRALVYSTNPYRRKSYTLNEPSDGTILLDQYESNLSSVQQIYIQNEKSVIGRSNYFPNATELIFKDGFSTLRPSVTTILDGIMPLERLTKLVMECHHFSFKKIIDLLYFTPNVHTLIFESMPLYKNDSASIEEDQTFQSVSRTNIITHVTFKDKCSIEKLNLLVTLCPRVQYLSTKLIEILAIYVRCVLRELVAIGLKE